MFLLIFAVVFAAVEAKQEKPDTGYGGTMEEEGRRRPAINGVNEKIAELNATLNEMRQKLYKMEEDQAMRGEWPDGAYCLLANGGCPEGFKTISGHMKAISVYSGSDRYIRQNDFGSSSIKCHGDCSGYGAKWYGDLNLVTCCK